VNSGYYAAPTIFTGNNNMRIFQEEIFARSWRSCTSPDYDDAIGIANDTLHGLGAGLWTGVADVPGLPPYYGNRRQARNFPWFAHRAFRCCAVSGCVVCRRRRLAGEQGMPRWRE
jgi:hypothetical protein